ncbi:hypothetical protein SAMN05660971_04008 [Halomonas cupida]|uniref:Uncharacterized protein n=2 Tax=Halomonas cupida TaxID=44933 RepID=A0A1M7LY60_9GAMM|nr:hypothetical protein SAMN05660971_04008 [Halomonas cupida]
METSSVSMGRHGGRAKTWYSMCINDEENTMRILLPVAVLLGATLLAGCSYHPARISPEPLIILDDDHRHDDRYYDRGRGGFCPPGQAKKGRC